VHTASAGTITPNAIADDLIVENNDNAGISILAPANKISALYFGNPNDNDVTRMFYDHQSGVLYITRNAAAGMTFAQDGGIFLYNLKSGATQAAAGAEEYELWTTEEHATLPDNVVIIGA